MSDPQVTRRHRSWATVVSLASVAATALGSIASTASAAAIQYTMTWNQVSGSYGSTSFTNETLTITFDYDTNNVTQYYTFPYYQAVFANGAGISVTLGSGGSILNDAALDAIAQNNSGLLSYGTAMFFGTSSGGVYGGDRGSLSNFATGAPAVDWLTTAHSSTASGGTINSNWANSPLVINSHTPTLNTVTSTNGGSWEARSRRRPRSPAPASPGLRRSGSRASPVADVAERRSAARRKANDHTPRIRRLGTYPGAAVVLG